MAVTVNATKLHKDIFKKVFEMRPVTNIKRKYSQNKELVKFFKFYSDSGKIDGNFKPLSDNDYQRFVSLRSSKREPALTRQITTLSYKVGKQVLSLAEGMPNEQAFPYTKLTMEMTRGKKLELEGPELAKALQYVPSQGLPSLLTELRQFQEDLHRPPPLSRDILVTNGGQHGIYQCMELLLNPGDPILTTQYAYTGLHSTLKPYSPEVLGIPEDADGLIPETLDNVLGDRMKRGLKMPKVLYIIPTGNNPTGTVLTEDRRRQVYGLACKYDFLILEDDPYMFLNYSVVQVPSFLSLDTCGRVLRLDSVSKVVSAGLRGGWVTAPTPLLQRLELHSQAELLHSCTLAQAIILHLISDRAYVSMRHSIPAPSLCSRIIPRAAGRSALRADRRARASGLPCAARRPLLLDEGAWCRGCIQHGVPNGTTTRSHANPWASLLLRHQRPLAVPSSNVQ